MKKVLINNVARILSPFAYKDIIKSLDKSNEARVTIDGKTVFRSAVTSGKDVKNAIGGMKYHVYMYLTEAAASARDTELREWMPITAEEYRAYKNDAGFTLDIISAPVVDESLAAAAAEGEKADAKAARAETKAAGRKAMRVEA